MAILIDGMPCGICGRAMSAREELVSFPPFVANEADPLFPFSDGVFHNDCFDAHPLSRVTRARLMEMQSHTDPKSRRCVVCQRLITDPDDFVSVGHLTDDTPSWLHALNYSCLHRSCIPLWSERTAVVTYLEEQLALGNWRGKA